MKTGSEQVWISVERKGSKTLYVDGFNERRVDDMECLDWSIEAPYTELLNVVM